MRYCAKRVTCKFLMDAAPKENSCDRRKWKTSLAMTWSVSRSPEVENLDITYALCVSVCRACLQNAVAFDRKYFPGYIRILYTWHGSSLKDLSTTGRDLVHRKITVLVRRLENVPDPSNLPSPVDLHDRHHRRTIFNASLTASEGNVRFQVCPEEAAWPTRSKFQTSERVTTYRTNNTFESREQSQVCWTASTIETWKRFV